MFGYLFNYLEILYYLELFRKLFDMYMTKCSQEVQIHYKNILNSE
jgi:hypothetical protein